MHYRCSTGLRVIYTSSSGYCAHSNSRRCYQEWLLASAITKAGGLNLAPLGTPHPKRHTISGSATVTICEQMLGIHSFPALVWVSLSSAQFKAAALQIRDRNLDWENRISCPPLWTGYHVLIDAEPAERNIFKRFSTMKNMILLIMTCGSGPGSAVISNIRSCVWNL